jgi:protein-tyrosine phosphatase
MPTVLDWSPAVDPSEFLRAVREAIAAGSPVVLPGECGYVVLVNPSGSAAAEQLGCLAGLPHFAPAVLAWGPDDPIGLGFQPPPGVQRLMTRGWPAPLAIAFTGDAEWPGEWPASVRESLQREGVIRFRCPEHPVFDAVTPALDLPVLVVDTFLSTIEEVLDLLDDPDAIAVSAGPIDIEGKPSVVTVFGAGQEAESRITERGLLSEEEIEKLASRIILFVCTGNTCRSPLAERLAKKLLAERLACGIDELPQRGFWVVSAGVSASSGTPATSESVEAAAELGCDLSQHESRPVHPQLLAAADDVIAMTRGHAHALASRYPGLGPTPVLLCGDDDLDDPIGAGLGVYRECARTILRHLERFLPAWVGS